MKKYRKLSLAPLIRESVPKPVLELSDEKIEKIKTYSKVVLTIVEVLGLAAMTVVAPNAIQALAIFEKKHGRKPLKHKQKIQKTTNVFYYLRRWGYIEIEKKNDDYLVTMTDKGKKVVKNLQFQTLAIPSTPKWDGTFWQVAADIPTKEHRRGADALRLKLKEMGFYPLQRTLWFYPYDPRMEIEFIARYYGIANFVTVMKVTELDQSDSKALKAFFKKQAII